MAPEFLVTGGGGFIGSNLVHTLVASGRTVRVLDNFSTGRRENLAALASKIDLVDGDLCRDDVLKKAVEGVRYIMHFAALPSVVRSVEDPRSTNNINVGGTLNLLLAARDAGVERVVFSSSSSVYGNTATLPKREDMLPEPLSPYALSKLAGEHYCRMFRDLYGLRTFSLRYFNVFGPRQNPKSDYAAVIPLFVDALMHDRAPLIYGDGEQTRDFTYVDDVVAANLCCCQAPDTAAGGVYNVAWGRRTSVNELAQTIASVLGKKIASVHKPERAGDVRDSQADSTRARDLLGWKPGVTFEEGLKRTVEWFRAGVSR